MRVVGSEPALSARLLRIANSASLNRSGKPVTDLRTAINRIGHNMVRSASISFAMAQIRKSNKLVGLEDQLQHLWKESTAVAALAFVLARNCTRVNPDEAMLTGMMHGIGKLYVLTRAVAHPELFRRAAHARCRSSTNGMPRSARRSWRTGSFRRAWRRRSGSRKSSAGTSRRRPT